MIDFLIKIWDVIKDADERFGFKKILMYTTYILVVAALINWKSILSSVNDYMDQMKKARHDRDMIVRDKIGTDTHSYLIEFRVKSGADRVLLFGFHNSISNLIGIPFKYVGLTDYAVAYGSTTIPSCKDVNSEIVGNFIRELKVEMFKKVENIEDLRKTDPFVPEILNSTDVTVSSYQYMSVLGKPLGILVLEWYNPENIPSSAYEWNRIRNLCGQATQDLNTIILKYKYQN